MPFACGAQTENETQATFRRVRLVGVPHDAGVEQGRGFERIFVKKIGADQLPLDAGKAAMRRQRLFHFVGARLERFQQVAMAALEILQHIGELAGNSFGIEGEYPVDDMICACLVGRVEITWFSRRLERAHDHPRGVGTQMERLPVQEGGLQQGALGSLEWLLKSSTDGAKCRRSGVCQADVDVRKLPDLRETKKIGQDRLTPAVFISTIGGQSIPPSSRLRID